MHPRLEKLYHTDPLVNQILQHGGDLLDVLDALVERNRVLTERVILLDSIRPRRIGDRVWNCPAHLLPQEF